MNSFGVDAIVRIVCHFAFIYLTFWSLQALRIDQFFKKNNQPQIRMFLVLISIGIGYLASTFFLEILALFRNLFASAQNLF
ncbi:DUF1146 family protein [Enterococcus timonensis]|uniref:DUF1146 family protein n=1 Tax=Enterococcus timonensis TaxID=1852364 RepID=UPI0008D90F87|nr:DUF1146 family protein [Enterococcus timonensis]